MSKIFNNSADSSQTRHTQYKVAESNNDTAFKLYKLCIT